MTNQEILHIIRQFVPASELLSAKELTAGNINRTYLVETKSILREAKYILQNINTKVFKTPKVLLQNTALISKHIEKKLANDRSVYYQNFGIYPSANGSYCFASNTNDCWRLIDFIEAMPVENEKLTQHHIKEGAGLLGRFHLLLSDIDSSTIGETIPNFHHTDYYFNQLLLVAQKQTERKQKTQDFLDRLLHYKYLVDEFVKINSKKLLPVRVVHNDPKLDNMLFDNKQKACTMIDLDTCMQGYLPVDFGDAIRSISNSASENETDLSKVRFQKEVYAIYLSAYLSEVKDFVSKNEIKYLPFFAQLITFEQALRFYTDYIQDDIYYKTDYDEHNLNRAKVQLKLLVEMSRWFETQV